jgi:hypothetical protein
MPRIVMRGYEIGNAFDLGLVSQRLQNSIPVDQFLYYDVEAESMALSRCYVVVVDPIAELPWG